MSPPEPPCCQASAPSGNWLGSHVMASLPVVPGVHVGIFMLRPWVSGPRLGDHGVHSPTTLERPVFQFVSLCELKPADVAHVYHVFYTKLSCGP